MRQPTPTPTLVRSRMCISTNHQKRTSSLNLAPLIILALTTILFSLPLAGVQAFTPTCNPQMMMAVATTTRHLRRTILHSDVPRDNDKNKIEEEEPQLIDDLKSWMPPPPDNQFIITGDVSLLFLYAFSSHYLNDFLVSSVISSSDTIQDAIQTLDPAGDVTKIQNPVWVATDQTQVVQSVLTINAQDSLMNHWGPLFSTTGSSCVALCTCWLIAGWLHRAFLFSNSLDCETPQALLKTFETWLSMLLLMMALVWTSNTVTTHLPTWLVLQSTAPVPNTNPCLLTKADTMFLVDSATVLIAWRYMANVMMKLFR